ncbi:MAG: DUF6139 family protein [Burkholderiaceae bacterium]
MQLDIYSRHEPENKLSYMAVPSGKPIPQEVINTDWHLESKTVELDESKPFGQYSIDEPARQLREKGYAITSVKKQPSEKPSA